VRPAEKSWRTPQRVRWRKRWQWGDVTPCLTSAKAADASGALDSGAQCHLPECATLSSQSLASTTAASNLCVGSREATLILVTRSSFAGGSLQMCDSSALEACSPRIVSLFQPRTGARSHIEACCCPEHRGSVSYRTRCPFSSPLCCLTGCGAALRQRKGTRRRSLCCDAKRSRRPRRAAHNPPPSCFCAFASAGKLP